MKYIVWETIDSEFDYDAKKYDTWEEVDIVVKKFCEKYNILNLYDKWVKGEIQYIVCLRKTKGIFVTSEYLNKPVQ
jgi:hypothetical protein